MFLTDNFAKLEFESHDGSEMPSEVLDNIQILTQQLQVLRNYLGRSIHISSGYRSPEHNKLIGGVKNSQHVLGKAADIYVKGMPTSELHQTIEKLISEGKMIQGGLGLYSNFVHYDIRNKKARW